MVISDGIVTRINNVSHKICREISKHTFCIQKIFPEILCFTRQCAKQTVQTMCKTDSTDNVQNRQYRQCAKQTVQTNRPQTATQYDTEMKFCAYWIAEATDRHSDCVIIVDFPLQQWLSQKASVVPLSRSRSNGPWFVARRKYSV